MTLTPRPWAMGLLALAVIAAPGLLSADPIADARARLTIEAERVEREFTDGRAAAFRLVRSSSPRLADALDKIDALTALVSEDRSLAPSRREQILVTLKSDVNSLRRIAEERRRAAVVSAPPIRPDTRPGTTRPSGDSGKGRVDDTKARLDKIKDRLADGRTFKTDNGERRVALFADVEKSAKPEYREYTFPKNWKELSEKRSTGAKLTETERSIMKGLDKAYEIDFDKTPYQDAMDYLRKVTGLPISVDKRAVEEAGSSYDTPVTLKNKLSLRSILKKMNSDLGLAYVVKDETILITSQARANSMVSPKTYYLGDLVAQPGLNLDPITNQLAMQQRVNMIISTLMQTGDRSSWKLYNPDAVGTITFDPVTMSLIVKQTAEFHFKNFGR